MCEPEAAICVPSRAKPHSSPIGFTPKMCSSLNTSKTLPVLSVTSMLAGCMFQLGADKPLDKQVPKK